MNKKSNPRDKRVTLVGFKATSSELAALKHEAARLGVSVADILRMAVRTAHPEAFAQPTR